MTPMDESARWKKIAADNELFWQEIQDKTYAEPRDTIQWSIDKANPIHQEAKQFYDTTKHALSYYNGVADVTINMGQENVARAYNSSASTITNTTPVYLVGDTFKIASKYTFVESRFIGVATHDIPSGTWGYATNLGEVGGDFSGFTENATFYLGDGELTETEPSNGDFSVYIGKKKNDGVMYVMPTISTYTAEMLQPTGWADSDGNGFPDNVGIQLLTDRTLVLIATPADDYYYYQNGLKYTSSTDTFQWSTDEGVHLIYFNNGSITETLNPTEAQSRTVVEVNPGVINLYWSIPQDTFIFVNNEFHTFDMNGKTKAAIFDYHGCSVVNGIGLVDFDIDGGGSLDAHAQFGANSGTIRNQDILTSTPAVSSTFGYTAFYKEGATSWRSTFSSGFGCINTGTGRIAYNENVAGSYQLTEATSNYYVPYLLLVSNTLGRKHGMVPCSNQYASKEDAVIGAINEANALLANLPVNQIANVGVVLFQTRDVYTNSVKGRLVSMTNPFSGETVNYIDLTAGLVGGGGGGTGMASILDDPTGPSSYAGASNKLFGVNSGETGWEFKNVTVDASGNLTANTLVSTVAIGTSPVTVTSATLVTNLNTDFLDGQHGSYYLDRTNHTGTQIASTISDFASTLAGTTNTTVFTPTTDYHVATKKYVDDNTGAGLWTDAATYIYRNGDVSIGKATSTGLVFETESSDADYVGLFQNTNGTTGKGLKIQGGGGGTSNSILELYNTDPALRFDFRAAGQLYLKNLDAATAANMLYIQADGEITTGAAPGGGDITAVNTAALSGLAGGATSGDVSLTLDIDNLTSELAILTSDYIAFEDVGVGIRKTQLSNLPFLATGTKLDDLSTPDDNTDLNATTSYHGLLPKLGGGTTNFLRADGTWSAPAGGSPTLADIATNSPTTADQTFQLNSTTDFIIENSGGATDILTIAELDGDAIFVGSLTSDESRVQSTLADGTVSMYLSSGHITDIVLAENTVITIVGLEDGKEGRIEVTNGSPAYTLGINGSTGYTTEVVMGTNAVIDATVSSHTTVVFWRTGSTLYYGYIYDN